MNKFYSEVTLLNQTYILDQDKTVKKIIDDYYNDYEFSILSFNLMTL